MTEPAGFNRERVIAAMSMLAHEVSLEIQTSVDSTNRILLERAREGAASGEVLLAARQTAGRGRRGKSWTSPVGNIYVSVLWRFSGGADRLGGLSLAVGLGIAELVERLGASAVELKWPNDVLWQGSKLCGILLEVEPGLGHGVAGVIGVGLNFEMPEAEAAGIGQAWTDLRTAVGRALDRDAVAGELISVIISAVRTFEREGMTSVLRRWHHYDALRDLPVAAFSGNHTVLGTAAGIDKTGALLLEVDGELVPVYAGEVSVRVAGV